jgi:RarD protein
MFALLSAYAKLLAPLSGLDIFAWRIVWTVPGALLLIVLRKRLPILRQLLYRMVTQPRLAIAMGVSAVLLGAQLWVFLWAPLHGRMLEVSLGYFLLPLVMVLVGRFYYHERLDGLQWLAVICAALGVAHELWMTGAFSWPRRAQHACARFVSEGEPFIAGRVVRHPRLCRTGVAGVCFDHVAWRDAQRRAVGHLYSDLDRSCADGIA